MLQRGACVYAAVKQCSSRVPTHPSASGKVEDTVLIEEGQARSLWSTAAQGNGGAGQEEYPVQADQGHQGPHRYREVSSTHYHHHTPHHIIPFIPLPHCNTLLPSSLGLMWQLTLFCSLPNLSSHLPLHTLPCPCNHCFTIRLASFHSSPLLTLLPPLSMQKAPEARCGEAIADPSDSTAVGLAMGHQWMGVVIVGLLPVAVARPPCGSCSRLHCRRWALHQVIHQF